MKTTLFARWRRGTKKTRQSGKGQVRTRQARLESLESRALLTATSFSAYDINHDGYFNLSDVIAEISYFNANGPGAAPLATTTGHSMAALASSSGGSSTTSNSTAPAVDVNGDGYVNLTDVLHEIQAFDTVAPEAAYTIVPTDNNDVPLSGPIVVGQTFYIDVLVQDLRTVAYAGVAGAAVDVAYTPDSSNPGAVTPVTPLSLQPGAAYPSPSAISARANIGTAGVIQNINGAENFSSGSQGFYFAPLGGSALMVDRIQMTATTAGVVNFTSEVLNAQLEQTILASGTGQQTASDSVTLATNQLSFGTASVTIVNAPPVPATLAGRVYVDSNGDGTFDTGDSGLGNVAVVLLGSNGLPVGSPQFTAADGTYSFTNITPGTYSVGEVQPSGFFETAVNVGTVNGTTSGSANGLNTIQSIVLPSGSAGVNYNFGVEAPVGLSGTAYVDQNNDNTFDTGDTVLAGVSVQLLDSTGQAVGSAKLTDASGNYTFTNLAPGTYSLKETPPAGAFATAANVGSINGSAVGTPTDNQTISTIALGSGQAGTGYDFALGQFGTISGTEYVDNDANNSFNTGDSPLSGVTIQLLNGASQVVNTTTTASDGTYSFINVVPGTYTLHEGSPGSGLVATSSTIGSANGTQLGVDTITTIVIGNGTVGSGYNFGTQSNVPPIVQVRLAATALDGSALPSTIQGGSKFWLYEYVTDLRQPTSDALGVQEAYSTITFDASKFQVISPLTFGTNYQYSESPANGQAPANLANVGAFAGTTSFPALGLNGQGAQEQLVFKVELEAIGGGSSDITVGLPTSTPINPLGIAVFPDPPAFDSPLLAASQVHFIGLSSLQTTEPTLVSIDSPVAITNSTTNGATTPLNFTVHLSAPSPVPVTVTYTTQDIGSDNAVGGATPSTPGADYVLPDFDGTAGNENVGQFTIPANTQDLTVPLVQAIGNSLNQADKSFHVVLTTADNNIVVSQSAGASQAVIHSAVPLPTISVQPTSGNEGGVATFSVTVSAGSGQTITVHYATAATNPQSAIPGTDFDQTSGDLTFLPSSTGSTQTVQIALPFDVNEVPPTTFQFILSAATNANLSNGQSQLAVLGTILPVSTGSLSGYVYHDINSNGLRESGEGGYAGVTVALTGTTIYGQTVSRTTTTAADGSYTFGNLVQGHYVITETQPLIYLEGKDSLGTLGGTASVQDQFTVDMAAGATGTNYNFGEGDVNPNMFWWPYF
jgi:uncharacterized protein (DUF2141 family)